MATSTFAPITNSTDLEFTPVTEIQNLYGTVSKGHATGVTKSLEWRLHQLKQLAYMLQDNVTLFEEALTIDLGRSKSESQFLELIGTRNEVLNALKHVKAWMKPESVRTDFIWLLSRPKIHHEPKGVVLIFGTWNYPVSLLIASLVGAIAGGNSVVLKPSENAPATTNLITKLLSRYMDPNNICVVNGSGWQSSKLLEFKFDHIFFTGSPAIGKLVAQKAAETLTPITLELGGKCPAIVFDDADITVAARRILWGKAVNAGQTCIAPDYVLVSKKSEQKLITAMKTIMKQFYPVDGSADSKSTSNSKSSQSFGDSSQYCKIIDERRFHVLERGLSQTKGEIISLDLAVDDKPNTADVATLQFPLTLVRNLSSDDYLMQEEIFGPILPIMTYDSEKGQDLIQFLHQINLSTPLAIYAFSTSSKNLEYVRHNTRSGQFVCNDVLVQFVVPGLPFGGVGTSGIGNYHGHHSFLTFTHPRAAVTLPFWSDVLYMSRYPPYESSKLKAAQLVLGPKSLSGQSNPKPPALTDVGKLNSSSALDLIDDLRPLLLKVSVVALVIALVLTRQQSPTVASI